MTELIYSDGRDKEQKSGSSPDLNLIGLRPSQSGWGSSKSFSAEVLKPRIVIHSK